MLRHGKTTGRRQKLKNWIKILIRKVCCTLIGFCCIVDPAHSTRTTNYSNIVGQQFKYWRPRKMAQFIALSLVLQFVCKLEASTAHIRTVATAVLRRSSAVTNVILRHIYLWQDRWLKTGTILSLRLSRPKVIFCVERGLVAGEVAYCSSFGIAIRML